MRTADAQMATESVNRAYETGVGRCCEGLTHYDQANGRDESRSHQRFADESGALVEVDGVAITRGKSKNIWLGNPQA